MYVELLSVDVFLPFIFHCVFSNTLNENEWVGFSSRWRISIKCISERRSGVKDLTEQKRKCEWMQVNPFFDHSFWWVWHKDYWITIPINMNCFFICLLCITISSLSSSYVFYWLSALNWRSSVLIGIFTRKASWMKLSCFRSNANSHIYAWSVIEWIHFVYL